MGNTQFLVYSDILRSSWVLWGGTLSSEGLLG